MEEWMVYEYKQKISMTENFKTPIYVRKFRLDIFNRLNEQQEEKQEEMKNNVPAKNGKRKTSLSGEQLKSKLRNNEINPNQVD